jgi:GT2 family glycosyltransferase
MTGYQSISVIVPIYNTRIIDIPAFLIGKKDKDIEFVICDNSTDEIIKEENNNYSNRYTFINYCDMKGNKGISVAYNYGIEHAKGNIICIFDDDTMPGENYFSAVRQYVNEDSESVYVPVVMSGNRMLSPLKVFGPVVYRTSDVTMLRAKNISAFNAGMVYSRDIAKKIKYDENLFLEFVDHDFCRRVRQAGINIRIMEDVILEQDYSRYSDNKAQAQFRLKTACHDLPIYYNNSIVSKIYCKVYLLYRLMSFRIRY